MNKQLKDSTLKFINLCGFNELTTVQNECINFVRSRKDLITIAKTGTGKTHAYLIPICEMINPKSDKTQVLISLPTRELAYQVYQNTLVMKKVFSDLRIALISGGTEKKTDSAKPPHIIVGTPGRIKDLFENNKIRVDFVQMFVIDEADMTLDYGFLEDIDVVFSHMVKNPEVLCYSATFSKELRIFVKKYLSNPKVIEVEDKKRNPKIEHVLVPCKHLDYNEAMLKVLKGVNPYICLIFANSKDEASKAYELLINNGYKTLLLHGGLENRERQKAIKSIQREEYKYIVASDVASRGIDIDGVTHVISMGFPKELEFYTHRAGRTGRNTRSGICFALYKEEDIPSIRTLSKQGIVFSAKDYKGGTWKTVRNPIAKREVKFNEEEKKIVRSLYRKNEKVKPNYKKKKNRKIEEIKKNKRRELIKSKIKEQKKQRYKDSAKLK